MISGITVGVSNASPLVLTTSVVPANDIDEVTLIKLLNASNSAGIKCTLNVTKHLFEQYDMPGSNSVFLSYNAFELNGHNKKVDLSPLTSLFINSATEEQFVQVIKSFIHALSELEKARIDINQVHIMPREIYFTSSYDVRLIVLPIIDATPTNYPEFFAELFSRLPFTLTDPLFLTVGQYFSVNLLNYTFTELYNLVNTEQAEIARDSSSIMKNLESSQNIGPNASQAVQYTHDQALSSSPSQAPITVTLTDITTNENIAITKFPFTIGRSRDFSDFVIDNPKISSVHCRIIKDENGQIQIIDANSTNHVRINEEKITANEAKDLRTGDLIRLADITFRIHF